MSSSKVYSAKTVTTGQYSLGQYMDNWNGFLVQCGSARRSQVQHDGSREDGRPHAKPSQILLPHNTTVSLQNGVLPRLSHFK